MKIKEEAFDPNERETRAPRGNNNVILITSSTSSSSDNWGSNAGDFDDDDESHVLDSGGPNKRRRKLLAALPLGFLDPLSPGQRMAMQLQQQGIDVHNVMVNNNIKSNGSTTTLRSEEEIDENIIADDRKKINSPDTRNSALIVVKEDEEDLVEPLATVASPLVTMTCRQFWKAGDYQASDACVSTSYSVGMDHVRVHPKFLHSNATSHKWALGAFAELLDNALDEVCNGATYVHVDMLESKKHKSKMLLVQDNGGGMTPDKMRQCMSLGYSEKSKLANTIGQYGNGFKTSTMRLGADVIVFSRCPAKNGRRATQSIGMLSYTFLKSTWKEDIVVPMIDYEKCGNTWNMMTRSSLDDWRRNLDNIIQWSPYEHEEDLLHQFDFLEAQGTRVIIYNLWEDDEGYQELDFDADETDIQIRGVNRDPKKIAMAKTYPNSRHFLTYRHSLRSYASILYLRIPPGFRIILRKKDIAHHNIVNDMMGRKEITYKPTVVPDETRKDSNMVAVVTIGFVKDAKHHIDIQGFNVYHKNRLIKPFWRVWNAAGSNGRGVIGVLEANFVEPAHDKQGFERTIVLSRLEARLVHMQKTYWTSNSHLIGYAKKRFAMNPLACWREATSLAKGRSFPQPGSNGHAVNSKSVNLKPTRTPENVSLKDEESDGEMRTSQYEERSRNQCRTFTVTSYAQKTGSTSQKDERFVGKSSNNSGQGHDVVASPVTDIVTKLRQENNELRERLQEVSRHLHYEKDKNKSLESQLQEARQKLDSVGKDQEVLVDSFIDERVHRDTEEESMRQRLKEASETIQQLLIKVKMLEKRAVISCKSER